MELVTVSYSGLMMYENCPSSFQRKYVTKEEICHEYEPSKQSMRGSRIHNGIDAYLKDYDLALPEEVKKHERLIAQLKEDGAESEKRFAFNEEWVGCGFTCETARIRGVIDVVVLRLNCARLVLLSLSSVLLLSLLLLALLQSLGIRQAAPLAGTR